MQIFPDGKYAIWTALSGHDRGGTTGRRGGSPSAAGEPPAPKPFPGDKTTWNGFDRFDFKVLGRKVLVVAPGQPAPGRPWVWRGRFFGHRPEADVALLRRGFHVAYMDVPEMLGSPEAVRHWDAFYRVLTEDHGLSRRPALEGMSRGGLHVLNWAIAHPDRVSCLYLDAPVCDFKSWPGGRGKGKGSPADWKLLLKAYGFRDDAEALAYPGNPVDNLRPLAEARVPILIVSGDADDVVPFPENAGLLEDRFRRLGGSVRVIVKPGVGHKHGLDDPSPIVEFIAGHAAPQAAGVVTHTVESEFQKGPTVVRVLPPSKVEPGRRYPVLYILPVQPGLEPRWGDGLDEVRKLGLHDKFGLFCVAPTFSDWPWYADHPTDPAKRQESYLLKTVLPLVESRHPVLAKPEGRLLLGFSKSGWGAFALLLRHPDTFGRAAAFDAPLWMDWPTKYGSAEIFGTAEAFSEYRIRTLLEKRAGDLARSGVARLALFGDGNFRGDHERLRELLEKHKIPHHLGKAVPRRHHWGAGWVADAVGFLASAEPGPPAP